MSIKRREFIGVTGLVLLAGCTSPEDEEPAEGHQDPDSDSKNPVAPDADGDGVPDARDDFPNDPNHSKDSDSDGVPDGRDDFPNDPNHSKDSDNDRVPDSEDDYPNDRSRSKKFINKEQTITVAEDEVGDLEFRVPEKANVELDISVVSGPRVDIFTMDSSNYIKFQKGDNFRHYSSIGGENTLEVTGKGGMDSGAYYVVIDNTNSFEANPPSNFKDDIATVRIRVNAYK